MKITHVLCIAILQPIYIGIFVTLLFSGTNRSVLGSDATTSQECIVHYLLASSLDIISLSTVGKVSYAQQQNNSMHVCVFVLHQIHLKWQNKAIHQRFDSLSCFGKK